MRGGLFGAVPLVEHVPLHLVQHLVHLGRGGVGRQLQAVAGRVAEVDRLEDGVVGGPDHFDAVGLHLGLDFQHGVDGIDLQRQVLRPRRGVGIRRGDHGLLGRQLEERQDVAPADVDEDVHVGVGLLGGGHLVFGNGEDEIGIEVLLVPLHGFLRVFAAVSDMVNAVEKGHGCLLGWGVEWIFNC